ncbi:VOC family protein [Clostridium sp. UBA5119]|uniref:VOC family protein n=1 Tax=Clostridium sp. UBA5119 TaxID=1946366 RepID=UPI0032167EDC
MFVPHLHFSGECYQAMEMYVKAFDATIKEIIFIDKEKPEIGVLHGEMLIHGQRIMLNDNRSENCHIAFPYAQLVVIFENEVELKKAFEILKDEQKVIYPMKATDFTSCTVGFWDKYGIRWGFMVE